MAIKLEQIDFDTAVDPESLPGDLLKGLFVRDGLIMMRECLRTGK
jgi:hypothetical protein